MVTYRPIAVVLSAPKRYVPGETLLLRIRRPHPPAADLKNTGAYNSVIRQHHCPKRPYARRRPQYGSPEGLNHCTFSTPCTARIPATSHLHPTRFCCFSRRRFHPVPSPASCSLICCRVVSPKRRFPDIFSGSCQEAIYRTCCTSLLARL